MSGPDPPLLPRPAALAFLGLCIAWSTTFLPMKVGLDRGLPPLTFAAARILLAALILAPLAWSRGEAWIIGGRRERGRVLLSAVLMVALSLGLIFWGEQHTASGVPALIVATQPLVVVCLIWAVDRRRPSGWTLAALGCGLAGMALVFSDRIAAPAGTGLVAVAAMLAGSSSYVVGAVYKERRLPAIEPLRLVFVQLVLGGVILGAAAALADGSSGIEALSEPKAAAAVVYLALNTCVAFFLFLWLVGRIGSTRTSAYAFITPVVTLILGALTYSETVGWELIAGSVVILAGLALLRRGLAREAAGPTPARSAAAVSPRRPPAR